MRSPCRARRLSVVVMLAGCRRERVLPESKPDAPSIAAASPSTPVAPPIDRRCATWVDAPDGGVAITWPEMVYPEETAIHLVVVAHGPSTSPSPTGSEYAVASPPQTTEEKIAKSHALIAGLFHDIGPGCPIHPA